MSSILIRAGLAVDKDVNAMFVAETAKAAERAGTATSAAYNKAIAESDKMHRARQRAAEVADFDKRLAERVRFNKRQQTLAKETEQYNKTIAESDKMHGARQRAAEVADFDKRLAERVRFNTRQKALDKEAARSKRESDKEAARSARESDKEAARSARESDKEAARSARESDKEAARSSRMAGRSARQQERQASQFKHQVGRGIVRGLAMGAGMAGFSGVSGLARAPFDMAAGILGGMGADFTFSGAAGRAMGQERSAANLSNAGYIASDSNNNSRVAPSVLLKEARDAANAFGESTDSALDGMTRFVKKTGDLATIRPIFMDLAGLSKAYGADLGDMADAAADVSLQLKGVQDKGPAIISIMRTIAMQGKMGAVEISDLASQLAKVVAGSTIFANAEGKGSTGTIKQMTAFAQLARTQNASPQQAATAVGQFINAYSKPSRRAGMAKLLEVKESELRDKDGKFMDPVVMLGKLLRKVNGDWTKLAPAFGDAKSMAVTKGAAQLYTTKVDALKALGPQMPDVLSKAGEDAYLAGMRKQTEAMETDANLRMSLSKVTGDSMSVVQRYNNKMDELGGKMGDALLPMLEGLTGPASRLAIAFTGLADFLTNAKLLGKVHKGTENNARAQDAEGMLRSATESPTATVAEIEATKKEAAATLKELKESLPGLKKAASESGDGFLESGYRIYDRWSTALSNPGPPPITDTRPQTASFSNNPRAFSGPSLGVILAGMPRTTAFSGPETQTEQQQNVAKDAVKYAEMSIAALEAAIARRSDAMAEALVRATKRAADKPQTGDGTTESVSSHDR